MSDLEPCPLCGGEARLCSHLHLDLVRCTVCKAEGPAFMDHTEAAIAAWNRRAPSAAPQAVKDCLTTQAAYRAGAAEMREAAADKADAMADSWDADWRAERKASTHLEGKSDGAVEVAAAIRALPLPAGGSGWRPIETAPRDQWLYVWNAQHRWLRIGKRFSGAGPRWYFSAQASGAAQYTGGDEAPTHWQPLPAAPEEGG